MIVIYHGQTYGLRTLQPNLLMMTIAKTGANFKDVLLKVLCRQNNGLNICHINAQSLSNKLDELTYLCHESEIDIICVSETWFRKEIDD